MIWEKWNPMGVEWVVGSNPGSSGGEVLFAEVSCGRPNASFAEISLSLELSTTPSPPTRPPFPTRLGKAKREDALNPLLLSALSVGRCRFPQFFLNWSKQASYPVRCVAVEGRRRPFVACEARWSRKIRGIGVPNGEGTSWLAFRLQCPVKLLSLRTRLVHWRKPVTGVSLFFCTFPRVEERRISPCRLAPWKWVNWGRMWERFAPLSVFQDSDGKGFKNPWTREILNEKEREIWTSSARGDA